MAGVSPEVRACAQVVAGNQNWNTQILGVSADYFDIRALAVVERRRSSPSRTCAAPPRSPSSARPPPTSSSPDEDPVGQIIRIKNVPFTVIGVLAAKACPCMGADQDDVILVPYTSAMKRLVGADHASAPSTCRRPAPAQMAERAAADHRAAAPAPPHRPGEDDDFTVRNQQEIAEHGHRHLARS